VPAKRIVVSGIVQGVGYRYWTTRQAAQLGIQGWVRNLYDGRVEIHAEGTADALAELVDRCHDGPRFAEVSGVDERDVDPESHTSFDVRATG
jgi:acylphosphatase